MHKLSIVYLPGKRKVVKCSVSWHFVFNMELIMLLLLLLWLLLLPPTLPPPPAPYNSRFSCLWQGGSCFSIAASLNYLLIYLSHLLFGHPLVLNSIRFQSIFLTNFISEENCTVMSMASSASWQNPDISRRFSILFRFTDFCFLCLYIFNGIFCLSTSAVCYCFIYTVRDTQCSCTD